VPTALLKVTSHVSPSSVQTTPSRLEQVHESELEILRELAEQLLTIQPFLVACSLVDCVFVSTVGFHVHLVLSVHSASSV
jgi:hypothetical protein